MLEDKGVVDVDSLADLVVHGVDVGLVHSHALPGQRRGVVDRDVVELWVVLPVLVWIKNTSRSEVSRVGAGLMGRGDREKTSPRMRSSS